MTAEDIRVPPNALEAEGAIISDAMLDHSAFDEVADLLTAERFYAERHKLIWQAMTRLRAQGQPLDIITVGNELRRVARIEQVGGMGYLTELLNATPAIANKRAHAECVVETWRLREVARICGEAHSRVYAGGAESRALLDATETKLMQLGAQGETVTGEMLGPLAARTEAALSAAEAHGLTTTGIPTGMSAYDALTGGLHRGELTIVAARPGMGKTSLALGWGLRVSESIGVNRVVDIHPAAQRPLGAMMFSLEMPREDLTKRILCARGSVNVSHLRNLQALRASGWSRLVEATRSVAQSRFFIDDTSALTVNEMRSKVRRTRAAFEREGVDLALVILDYLQLMKAPDAQSRGGNREQEVSAISQALKATAKEVNVAVVALSQLNRSVETRPEKRPLLSDLRESGAIEQDADNICFVYRDVYYARKEGRAYDPADVEAAELILGKQRNGPVGTAFARFEEQYARFSDEAADVYRRGAAAE